MHDEWRRLPNVALFIKDREQTSGPFKLWCCCFRVFETCIAARLVLWRQQFNFSWTDDGHETVCGWSASTWIATHLVPTTMATNKKNLNRKKLREHNETFHIKINYLLSVTLRWKFLSKVKHCLKWLQQLEVFSVVLQKYKISVDRKFFRVYCLKICELHHFIFLNVFLSPY